jgi:hypothetical protein
MFYVEQNLVNFMDRYGFMIYNCFFSLPDEIPGEEVLLYGCISYINI